MHTYPNIKFINFLRVVNILRNHYFLAGDNRYLVQRRKASLPKTNSELLFLPTLTLSRQNW
jgi:hypothetical protein